MIETYKHRSLTNCSASSPNYSTHSFMKTAVIYARYSSTNQTEQSIEGQVHVCEDFAKRNNIIVVDSYIDRAISGTTDERDSFQKMLKDSNNKKWDYVLVYKLDRFARNKYESAIHRKHLKDNGIKLLSAMENIPETPEGVLLESLLEGMNQYFSEELAQKVSRGLHESRMKGHCIGSVPYGYTKEDKKLVINQEKSEILNRIYKDYASGKTILQISKDLENESITNKGQKFIPQTLRHFLQRKLYTGEYEINGKQYDNIYPQIITKDLFAMVKKKLDKNRYGCRKDNHEIFKLKDKIFCGYCNRKMYPTSAISSNGEHLRYYNCIGTKKENCGNKRMYKDFIEGVINKFLIEQFNTTENLELLTEKIFEVHKKRVSCNNSLNTLKSDLQKVNTAISNIMSAIEKGIFTETTKARLEELEKSKKNLQEKVVIEQAKERYELTKEDIQNYFKYTIKQCPNMAFELFIKFVKVYENKIEIGINYAINQTNSSEPIIQKVFTETYTTERQYKGGVIKVKICTYDIYVVI